MIANAYIFSVHLARRVLQLEKINTSLRQEVEREKKKIRQLADEVGVWKTKFRVLCPILTPLIQDYLPFSFFVVFLHIWGKKDTYQLCSN